MTEQTNFDDDFTNEHERTADNKFFKFENVGDTIIGYFRGFEEGGYGEIFKFEMANGSTAYISNYKVLLGRILKTDIDSLIKITYKGDKKTDKGVSYKDFSVYVKPSA